MNKKDRQVGTLGEASLPAFSIFAGCGELVSLVKVKVRIFTNNVKDGLKCCSAAFAQICAENAIQRGVVLKDDSRLIVRIINRFRWVGAGDFIFSDAFLIAANYSQRDGGGFSFSGDVVEIELRWFWGGIHLASISEIGSSSKGVNHP